ncbi:MAG: hypothetical protein WCO52_02100 [bacterium]
MKREIKLYSSVLNYLGVWTMLFRAMEWYSQLQDVFNRTWDGVQDMPVRGFPRSAKPALMEKPFAQLVRSVPNGFRFHTGRLYDRTAGGIMYRLPKALNAEVRIIQMAIVAFIDEESANQWYSQNRKDDVREIVHCPYEIDLVPAGPLQLIEVSPHLGALGESPEALIAQIEKWEAEGRQIGLVYDTHHILVDLGWTPEQAALLAKWVKIIHWQIKAKKDWGYFRTGGKNHPFWKAIELLFAAGCEATEVVVEMGWSDIYGMLKTLFALPWTIARRNEEAARVAKNLFDSLPQ